MSWFGREEIPIIAIHYLACRKVWANGWDCSDHCVRVPFLFFESPAKMRGICLRSEEGRKSLFACQQIFQLNIFSSLLTVSANLHFCFSKLFPFINVKHILIRPTLNGPSSRDGALLILRRPPPPVQVSNDGGIRPRNYNELNHS